MNRRDERGSAAVESVIGVPAFALFVGLIIFGGRTAITHGAVESAAADEGGFAGNQHGWPRRIKAVVQVSEPISGGRGVRLLRGRG